MPPTEQSIQRKLAQVAAEIGCYPLDAYQFVQQGLEFTVQAVYGDDACPDTPKHVTGQQLCEGLRQYAFSRWGLMAYAVLAHWNITSTTDFGRIVFAMIRAGQLGKTDQDTIDDFRNVYEFRTAFANYRIETVKS